MQHDDNGTDEADRQIADRMQTLETLHDGKHSQSAYRAANDLIRLAKRERRLMPLLQAQFHLVNVAQDLFEHHKARDVAIEMIALLESADRARQIQADFSEQLYAEACAWMTACAYDNLAKHTAAIHGYNSEGMHQCIADGIDVCRRTGKLRCIACFREYASDVYLASDDIPMALHHASLIAALSASDLGAERRWNGADGKWKASSVAGDLVAAKAAALLSLQLAESYHEPAAARMTALANLESTLWLLGQSDSYAELAGEPLAQRHSPEGERVWQDCKWDYRDSVAACCQGDYAKAIALLTKWDEKLAAAELSAEWFECRLRLIAAYRLAGQQSKVESLSQPLFKRAEKARDWLTLRRLRRLVDAASVADPTAMLDSPASGPFAANGAAAKTETIADVRQITSQEPGEVESAESPLHGFFRDLVEQLQSAEDDQARGNVLAQILAMAPASVVNPQDAARFLLMLPFLLTIDSPLSEIWAWARQTAALSMQSSYVVSLLANLAVTVRMSAEGRMDEEIPPQLVESMFRQSLDLDANNAENHSRAGEYYLASGSVDEAERCFARGFRLQRDNVSMALQLAEIYSHTDRQRDALGVLDLCLREGCDDADVAWQAAIAAFGLEQYDALLTYLDRYEALLPGQPWAFYYRAVGMLERGDANGALEALAVEETRSPDHPFGIEALRACAAAAVGNGERFKRHVDGVLEIPLAVVDYFSIEGISSLFARLWQAADCLPPDDEYRSHIERRMLIAGLAPIEMFQRRRSTPEEPQIVHHYRCVLRQPLDERWPHFAGCLHGQESWTDYRCLWDVLAKDEEEAAHRAIGQQAECYNLEATVEGVEQIESGYTDRPGVAGQGPRWFDDPSDRPLTDDRTNDDPFDE